MFLAKDKELQERFRAGETEAMDIIYKHYAPGVHRFLGRGFTFRSGGGHCHFTGIKSDDELRSSVQEVFRRAFEDRARNAYNGINSFSNWVLAISRNMVINRFRNREIVMSNFVTTDDAGGQASFLERTMTEEHAGMLYGKQTIAQDESYEQSELKGIIAAFMEQLDDDEKQLLVLRFVEGISQSDAATKLGSTRMKVRSAEAKLRRRLRAFLENTGYTDS